MTTPTAEVVETKEGKPIPFLPFVVQKINGFDEEYLYSFKSEEEAKREVDEWLCTSSVLRARILRLPSEAESALAPLYEARDRAAVEFATAVCACKSPEETSQRAMVFRTAQQALDAAIAAACEAMKGTADA